MNAGELLAIVAGSNVLTGLLTTVLTTWLTRGTGALEARVKALEDSLQQEYKEHGKTRRLLHSAVQHIRDMLSWLATDRTATPPPVPSDILREL